MENLEIILSIAATAVGLLITAATFLMKFLQSAKARKVAEGVIEIGNAILPYIKAAETFTTFSGVQKKEYVMTLASNYAAEHDIVFDKEQVSAKIEELVALTKTVNKR